MVLISVFVTVRVYTRSSRVGYTLWYYSCDSKYEASNLKLFMLLFYTVSCVCVWVESTDGSCFYITLLCVCIFSCIFWIAVLMNMNLSRCVHKKKKIPKRQSCFLSVFQPNICKGWIFMLWNIPIRTAN